MAANGTGPDIVIAGAARSGTSFLSATLSRHSKVDASAIKEPNYFSGKWSEGPQWYAGQYGPRADGLLRLDSSVSYTYPQHPLALQRLHDVAPHAKVIYAVRDPAPRVVSMYQMLRHYQRSEEFSSLGDAVDNSPMCLLSGDYGRWLRDLERLFPLEQVLVVPFPLITKRMAEGLDVILPWLGLAREDGVAGEDAASFRNEIREFRWAALGSLQRRMHKSRVYPAVRSAIGPQRLQSLRRLTSRRASIPSAAEELATLSPAQRARMDEVAERAVDAVARWLDEQDARLSLGWARAWAEHTAQPTG